MNPAGRVGSIARKIHRAWTWKLFRAYFWLDILLVILCAALFCLSAERTAGVAFDPETPRSFTFVEADPLESAYLFMDAEGAWVSAPVTDYAYLVSRLGTLLLIAQGFSLLIQALFGIGKARRLLKPLQKLAETTQRLSQPEPSPAPAFDDRRIHQLEDAISSIAPEEAELRTGDPDLAGLEEAVNSLLSRMRAAYSEQTRFVSDASHELRTPIAVIQGYASMLDRWGKNDPQVLSESVTAIKSEAERMNKLVEQLLFLARGDSGRQKPVMDLFDLSDMLREVCEESEMIDEKHVWKIELPERTLMCRGDRDMLKQTARILTDNASKYTEEGGTIRIRAQERPGETVFTVQDEGVGVAPEDVPKLFDRFFRSDPSREGKSGGTGLGLSIAKWIVERHGGYFEVLSRPGLGTRIAVCLPRVPEAAASS